jgi:hypothetical protein
VLTVDDIELIITTIEDASEDILQRHGEKQRCMNNREGAQRHPTSYPVEPRSVYCAILNRKYRIGG